MLSTVSSRRPCGARAVPARPRAAGAQRGLSLVELLVGVAIGLFIVAAAALMVGNQLTDNRRLLLETQLQQDMRATVDLISRQLRRAGTLESGQSQLLMAGDSGGFGTVNDPMMRIERSTPIDPSYIKFRYFLNLQDQEFEYQLVGGVVRAKIGSSAMQDLTDGNAMKVTKLDIGPPVVGAASERPVSERIPCPKLCPAPPLPGVPPGPRGCWPEVVVRNFRIELEAESARDARVQRRIVGEVRVRNDVVRRNTGPGTTDFCPS